jgi:hypothetical protein
MKKRKAQKHSRYSAVFLRVIRVAAAKVVKKPIIIRKDK